MVYGRTQSALYRAVDRHNSGFSGERSKKSQTPKHSHKPPEGCPRRNQNNPLDRLLSDKDMLLIAGLILVLLSEKSDYKLIIALAVVLLG